MKLAGGTSAQSGDLCNIEAEQALLGAVLRNNDILDRLDGEVAAEHFYQPAHERIYSAIETAWRHGIKSDAVVLRTRFEADPGLANVGGGQYLLDLATNYIGIINHESYAATIRDLWLRRVAAGRAREFSAYLESVGEEGALELIERASDDLAGLAERADGRVGLDTPAQQMEATQKHIEAAQAGEAGQPTGIGGLDGLIGGLMSSDLVILAGATGHGKSVLALNISENIARREKSPVLFISEEMSATQLRQRQVARATGIAVDAMNKKGQLGTADWDMIREASAQISGVPLLIDDRAGHTVDQIRRQARKIKRERGLRLVVVDYLQLLASNSRADNRALQVAEMSRGLKRLAMELQIPVLALSQLNREYARRHDTRPRLSDLRESGAIEQDANIVMFIHREYEVVRRSPPMEGEGGDDHEQKIRTWTSKCEALERSAEIIVDKVRQGQTGVVNVAFSPSAQEFG